MDTTFGSLLVEDEVDSSNPSNSFSLGLEGVTVSNSVPIVVVVVVGASAVVIVVVVVVVVVVVAFGNTFMTAPILTILGVLKAGLELANVVVVVVVESAWAESASRLRRDRNMSAIGILKKILKKNIFTKKCVY